MVEQELAVTYVTHIERMVHPCLGMASAWSDADACNGTGVSMLGSCSVPRLHRKAERIVPCHEDLGMSICTVGSGSACV